MKSIFLSYSSANRDFAGRIADRLSPYYDVFVDFSGIPGGSKWESEIEAAIRNADVFLVVVTAESARSEWVKREVLFAEHLRKPRIPVLASGEMPFGLIHLQYVDFRADFDGGVSDLLQATAKFAMPRPRHEHDADLLLGAAVRARLMGNIGQSDLFLKQAFEMDANMGSIDGLWERLGGNQVRTPLECLNRLDVVEFTKPFDKEVYRDMVTYEWSVHLEGHPPDLDVIDRIDYQLHPTFRPQHQVVRNRHDGFRLTQVGWGVFPLALQIHLKDGQMALAEYQLTFEETHREKLSASIPTSD